MLAKRYVAETYIVKRLDFPEDLRLVFKKFHRLFHSHFEYVRNRLPFEPDLQRLPIVALAFTGFTRHINIGQKFHLNEPEPRPLTRFTSSAFYIERKSTRLVSPDLGFRKLRKQIPDIGKYSRVSRRIRPRCSANRRLVDFNHFIYRLKSVNR